MPEKPRALALGSCHNAAFDQAVLDRAASRYGLPKLPQAWDCIMLWDAQYTGDWSDYWGSYRWYPLWGGGHRALSDAHVALSVLEAMTNDPPKLLPDDEQEE